MGKTAAHSECPAYDTNPSDGEVSDLDVWGMKSSPSLPLLLGPLWSGVVASDWVLPMGQIEVFEIWAVCKQMTYV